LNLQRVDISVKITPRKEMIQNNLKKLGQYLNIDQKKIIEKVLRSIPDGLALCELHFDIDIFKIGDFPDGGWPPN